MRIKEGKMKEKILRNLKASNLKDGIFEDGSGHHCCEKCGYCIECKDCDKYGCGSQSLKIPSSKRIIFC